MQAALEVGQKVRLSSGGPAMTVDRIKDETVVCVWFEGSELRTADFRPGVLNMRAAAASDDDDVTCHADNFG